MLVSAQMLVQRLFPARAGMNRGPAVLPRYRHAVPRTRGDEPPLIVEFSSLIGDVAEELRQIDHIDHAVEAFAPARMLWLERKGAVTYFHCMSARVRQLMDANADLLRRLINALP